MYCLRIIVIFLCIVNLKCNFFKPGAVTEIYGSYIRTCQVDADTRQKFELTYFKYNHTHTASNINWTVLEPFDKTYSGHFEVQKWSDGGWKKNFFNLDRDDVCRNMHLILGSVWRQSLELAGANSRCPIAPGFYQLQNYSVGSRGAPVSTPIYVSPGKFYCQLRILKNKKVSICVEYEIDLHEVYKYQ